MNGAKQKVMHNLLRERKCEPGKTGKLRSGKKDSSEIAESVKSTEHPSLRVTT